MRSAKSHDRIYDVNVGLKKTFQDDELTDVESTCSGLTDLSGVSDLEEDFEAMHDDDKLEKEEEKKTKKEPAVGEKRGRGKRAGKKNAKKQRLAQGPSIVQAAAAKVTILYLSVVYLYYLKRGGFCSGLFVCLSEITNRSEPIMLFRNSFRLNWEASQLWDRSKTFCTCQ